MVADYIEEFMAGSPRHATRTRLRTGVMRDGSIRAHHVQFFVNSGAYAAYKPAGVIGGGPRAAGPYRVPNSRVESVHVYTNTVPGGHMRAPGFPAGRLRDWRAISTPSRPGSAWTRSSSGCGT